jgi:hypothetical protein
MRYFLIVIAAIMVSCSPVQESKEYKTKYVNVPTMQSAEDANTKDFTEQSFK